MKSLLTLFYFIISIGSAQGKNQQEGVLGPIKQEADRPYILKPLRFGNPIWISIRPIPFGTKPLYKGEINLKLIGILNCSTQKVSILFS